MSLHALGAVLPQDGEEVHAPVASAERRLIPQLTPEQFAIGGTALGVLMAALGRKSIVGTIGWMFVGAFFDEVLGLWLVKKEGDK